MGMSSAVFYSVLFCLLGLILLALVAVRKHMTTTEETTRESSVFTYDESFADEKSAVQMSSPYPEGEQQVRKGSFATATGFVKKSSFGSGGHGYSTMADEPVQDVVKSDDFGLRNTSELNI